MNYSKLDAMCEKCLEKELCCNKRKVACGVLPNLFDVSVVNPNLVIAVNIVPEKTTEDKKILQNLGKMKL